VEIERRGGGSARSRPLLEDPPSRPAMRRRFSLSPDAVAVAAVVGRFHGNVRAKFVSRAAEPRRCRGIREKLSLNYEPLKRLRVRVVLRPPAPPSNPSSVGAIPAMYPALPARGHRRNEFSPLEGNAVSVTDTSARVPENDAPRYLVFYLNYRVQLRTPRPQRDQHGAPNPAGSLSREREKETLKFLLIHPEFLAARKDHKRHLSVYKKVFSTFRYG